MMMLILGGGATEIKVLGMAACYALSAMVTAARSSLCTGR
jgi:hypothetical protein